MGRCVHRRKLAALIIASALITLDGTATTIALPAIARDLSAPMARLQWIANAPLLALAAMLLPAGALADRFGRVRVLRTGLIVFIAASVLFATASSAVAVIVARLGQGAGGALVLPPALAILRAGYEDAAERTRVFGLWAAWTGAAAAAGPLLAGVLVDRVSWRAIAIPSIVIALASLLLLRGEAPAAHPVRSGPVPARAAATLVLLLAAAAYALMRAVRNGWADPLVALAGAVALASGAMLVRDPRLRLLFPRELLTARNCVPANAATFAFYFGMFGLSFLLVVYVQQVLRFSAFWAAIVLLPMSIMLLFAEAFGRLTAWVGTRPLLLAAALPAAGGIAWIGSAPDPVPLWSHIIVGTTLFGLGLSIAVSALTHAAVAAVPEECAGAASGLNHAVVRAAGVLSIALLGSIATPAASEAMSTGGFRRAVLICAAIVAAGGVTGTVRLRDDQAGGVIAES